MVASSAGCFVGANIYSEEVDIVLANIVIQANTPYLLISNNLS
jgi:hypothetical protein